MIQAVTTTRTTAVGLRVRRVLVRAGAICLMPPVKAAWCCQHVCGFRYADDMRRLVASRGMRVLVVEDELYMAEAIRDGLRLEAIAADIAGDGDTALELLSINAYDIAVLGRDLPAPFLRRDRQTHRCTRQRHAYPDAPTRSTTRPPGSSSARHHLTKPFAFRSSSFVS